MTGVLSFFFFKQKTAYEIYQCDWSSDVCSSDLRDTSALKKRSRSELGNTTYKIIEAPLRDMCFYGFSVSKKQFVLVLDPGHPFYREIYKPLLDANDKDSELLRMKLELLLLAAARTEAASPKAQQSTLAAYRYNWINTFETFIGG